VTAVIRLVVAGAGLVGKRHIDSIDRCSGVALSAIVDPSKAVKSYAGDMGITWYGSLSDMFARENPDGVILATPNQIHVDNGLECVAAGCPVLVEKPLATTAEEAGILVDAARDAGVPILVGHHRRHNPLVQKAREIIDAGTLGQLRAVHANCWLYKPDNYFDETP